LFALNGKFQPFCCVASLQPPDKIKPKFPAFCLTNDYLLVEFRLPLFSLLRQAKLTCKILVRTAFFAKPAPQFLPPMSTLLSSWFFRLCKSGFSVYDTCTMKNGKRAEIRALRLLSLLSHCF
jgi:hypothetical protein